jgi:hypothetical protein
MAILSRNGSDGNSNFRATGTGIVIRTAIQAALAVVFFQKIPKTNRAVMPGLTRPVYSWMNWKTWFMPVSVDAREAARIIMMKLDMRPVRTIPASESRGLKCTLNMSIVNMVDALLIMAARDEIMAAISAANTIDFLSTSASLIAKPPIPLI